MESTLPAEPNDERLKLTATVAASYVGHNKIAVAEIAGLIKSIFQALGMSAVPSPDAEKQAPAVPIRKSITPHYLVCLEDGKKLKMLKRHLQTAYGMTPDDYRAKWNLPVDYPMTAPAYAEARSNLAKSIGLGRTRPVVEVQPEPVVEVSMPKRRGRKPGVKAVSP